MKRFISQLIVIASVIFIAASCQQAPFITMTGPRSFPFTRDGGSQSITFTCNRDWSVSSSESWIQISPLSGTASDGEITVKITCAANTTYDARTATITLKVEDLTETISISQDTGLGLLVSPTTFDLTNAAQTIEIEVRKNVEYSFSIDPAAREWITHTGTKSLTSEKLTFTIAANETYDNREGVIAFKQGGGPLFGMVVVKQAGYPVPEAVDLGLSVNWGSFNVGAMRPEDYGGYYAWGETEEKDYFSEDTYKWGSRFSITKYNDDESQGVVDKTFLLKDEDDVARVILGDGWRMPTLYEQEELLRKCSFSWASLNGVNGYEVRSKVNGNVIFLPAAGRKNQNADLLSGKCGFYWSSSLATGYLSCIVSFFDNSEPVSSCTDRSSGFSVRAVKQNPNYVSVQKVALNKEKIELNEGESETLYATIFPDNATDKEVTWTSSDETVATVVNGKVTALRAGQVAITATVCDKMAICDVRVKYQSEDSAIAFKDLNIKARLVAAFDANHDGELSYSEAAAVKTGEVLKSAFGMDISFQYFDEFQFFSGITELTEKQFESWVFSHIILPDSLEKIGHFAFDQCIMLQSITIPNKVTFIGANAFYRCMSLEKIKLSNSLESIWYKAFFECARLKSVVIPELVTVIGSEAFSGCKNLEAITILAKAVPECSHNAFYDTNNCPIYVPAESVEAYKAADNWKDYAERIQAIPE